jgi:hypothetical protein
MSLPSWGFSSPMSSARATARLGGILGAKYLLDALTDNG